MTFMVLGRALELFHRSSLQKSGLWASPDQSRGAPSRHSLIGSDTERSPLDRRLPGNNPGYFVSVLLASLVIVTACQAQPKVVIATEEGRELVFQVEIADTPAKREQGLQYRRELAADQGMLFLFPSEAQQSFWMKNTPIPLDMIFIGKDRKIVGIVEQAAPFSLKSRSVTAASQYVLEINGGLSRRHGFRAGDSVRFEGIRLDNVKN
jgi:uncharacterized membrane protein (UPF0127 family)